MENELQNIQDTEKSKAGENVRPSLREYFLVRLERLVALRSQLEVDPKTEAWRKKALSHAIYSTMLDCGAQDVMEEAKLILSGKSPRS